MIETEENSVDWYHEIGEIIDFMEERRLTEMIIHRLRHLVPFGLASVFLYRGRSRPLVVFDDFERVEAKKGIAAYVENTYVLNPFYQAYLKGIPPGVYRIGDLAPDAYFESEYFRSYQASPRSSEEIGFITDHWPPDMYEVAVVVALEGNTFVEVDLYRPFQEGGFSDRDLGRLSAVQPVIAALFRKYWARFGAAGSQASPPDSRVDDLFASFGKSVLTDRECEVAQLILRGHSSESIGFNLGISLGTVKTHRKNVYAKLRISSQSELLSLFLRSL